MVSERKEKKTFTMVSFLSFSPLKVIKTTLAFIIKTVRHFACYANAGMAEHQPRYNRKISW